MGIEKFFNTLKQNDLANRNQPFVVNLTQPLKVKSLYLDFNSIVYDIWNEEVGKELNYVMYWTIMKKHKSKPKVKEYEEKYDFKVSDFASVEELSEYLNQLKWLNGVIISRVKNYVAETIIRNYVITDQLELLFIAMDGVPSISKMMEQKKRRYNGIFMSQYGKLVFQDEEESLKKDPERYQFEKLKVKWNLTSITPGTRFMVRLDTAMQEFEEEVKKQCPNLKKYIFSGFNIPGEGEMKIIEYINFIGNDYENYFIFSPDADLIILGLLLKREHVYIMRMKEQHELMIINVLKKNLIQYIGNMIRDLNLSDDRLIQDICFLMTLFGNDFVPKVESMNVRNLEEQLIDIYVKHLKIKKKYLLRKSRKLDKMTVRMKFFLPLLQDLACNEELKLIENYTGKRNFFGHNTMIKDLSSNKNNVDKDLAKFIYTVHHLNHQLETNKLDKKYWLGKKDFLVSLQKLVTQNWKNMGPEQMLDSYVEYYQKENKFPQIRVSIRKKESSLNDTYQQNRLMEKFQYLDDPFFNLTQFDKQIARMENLLDEFQFKFNAGESRLGKVGVRNGILDTKNLNGHVTYYYRDHFHTSPEDAEFQNIIRNYWEGIVWVLDYYFNPKISTTIGNRWFYRYHKAPLLSHLYKSLKTDPDLIKKIWKKVRDWEIPMKDYLVPLQQFLYVGPARNLITMIPKEYHEWIMTPGLYPEIDKIAKRVYDGDKDEIDCRGVAFSNKCVLKAIDNYPNLSLEEFIREFNKIQPAETTKKRLVNKTMESSYCTKFLSK